MSIENFFSDTEETHRQRVSANLCKYTEPMGLTNHSSTLVSLLQENLGHQGRRSLHQVGRGLFGHPC